MKKYNNVPNWVFGLIFLISGGPAFAGFVWSVVANGGIDFSPVLSNTVESWLWPLIGAILAISTVVGVFLLSKRHEKPSFRPSK